MTFTPCKQKSLETIIFQLKAFPIENLNHKGNNISKKILLTGARSIFTLDLARRFHEEGYVVYTADSTRFHLCRFSKAVKKNFTIPSPRFHSKEFINALVRIITKKKIDMIIPAFEEIFCLSKGLDLLPSYCKAFCPSYKVLDELHNKWRFNSKLRRMKTIAPKSFLIQSKKDLKKNALSSLKIPFILKPSYSRASQKVIKIDSLIQLEQIIIDPINPWIAQEFIYGKKFCSYSISIEGKLTAHAVYPLQFSVDDHSCLNFEAIEHPSILNWVKKFVEKEKFTGQIAFDFIESKRGKLYAIECNPRGTSGLHLFQKKDNLTNAFFNSLDALATPQVGFSKQFAFGMLLYGWRSKHPDKTFTEFIKKFFSTTDVIYSKDDITPFIFQPFLFFTYVLRSLKLRMSLPRMFTFDIDWNGEDSVFYDQFNYENFS